MTSAKSASFAGSIDLLAPHVRIGADSPIGPQGADAPTTARFIQDRRNATDLSEAEVGRQAFTLYNYRGAIVMAMAWLVAYVSMALLG